jgi:hypothetical protein
MNPVLERVEDLLAVGIEDHQLAVEHVLALREVELGEVAMERLAAAALDEDIATVDERESTEAVPFRLIGPTLSLWERLSRERQLRLDGRLDRKRH